MADIFGDPNQSTRYVPKPTRAQLEAEAESKAAAARYQAEEPARADRMAQEKSRLTTVWPKSKARTKTRTPAQETTRDAEPARMTLDKSRVPVKLDRKELDRQARSLLDNPQGAALVRKYTAAVRKTVEVNRDSTPEQLAQAVLTDPKSAARANGVRNEQAFALSRAGVARHEAIMLKTDKDSVGVTNQQIAVANMVLVDVNKVGLTKPGMLTTSRSGAGVPELNQAVVNRAMQMDLAAAGHFNAELAATHQGREAHQELEVKFDATVQRMVERSAEIAAAPARERTKDRSMGVSTGELGLSRNLSLPGPSGQ